MLAIRLSYRYFWLKLRRRSSFYVQLLIALLIFTFMFDKCVLKRNFQRRKIVVQKDLLNYNEDGLRPGWPFQINKHYDVTDVRSYTSKPKFISGLDWPGEKGRPIVLSPLLQELAKVSFSEYQINMVASDKVASNRSLPDLRDPKCLDIWYPKLLPKATVIMVIHNEAWSILLRAIWSVVNRSPDNLLEELIIVDDLSDKPHLKDKLDEYLPTISSKVKLIRTEKREGLIRARLIGAKVAEGQVLIFLDGNTESNDGWLEPLLSRIASDRSVIGIPHVDNINFTTMAYEEFDEGLMYGLGWNLYYTVHPIPEREMTRNNGDLTAPYRTAALIGCAIAVDREFFFEIGSFDEEMSIWGGENTELSLRVWQCGGAMEIVPCSRVGHYFRTLPYSFNADKDETKAHNNMRIAEVWMDEYKVYFDAVIPPHLKKIKGGDVSKRRALRQQLKCKGFHWYLKNVFPESVMLSGSEKIGQINKLGSVYCMDILGRPINRQIGIHTCHGHGYSQGFSYQKNHQIVFHHSLCLSLAQPEETPALAVEAIEINDPNLLKTGADTSNHVVLLNCNATNGTKWSYDEKNHQIMHVETEMCIATELWMIVITPCDSNDERQRWTISTFEEYKKNLLRNANKMESEVPH